MCSVQKDLYIFEDGLDGISSTNMPTELMIRDEIAHEALLIRLLRLPIPEMGFAP